MSYKRHIVLGSFTALIAFGWMSPTQAATFSLTPVNSEIGVGETMTVDLRIDSEGISFNAAQAVVRFPKETLEVTALDREGSAFNFWLEEPRFSNTEGVISLTGGTPYGVSGGAVGILKITFRAKGTGSGTLSLTEAAIAAADGSGTNILSKMQDAVITVVPQRVIPNVPNPQQKIPEPEQIVRKAVPSEQLPEAPVLSIPLYPEENLWYNSVSQFTASWDLPLDISGVSTALNNNPNAVPPGQSEGLFDAKTFGTLEDGKWYLHVRFKNGIGWGTTTTHHTIAIDTQPPLGFEVHTIEGEITDHPAPTLQFATSDALSGLEEYQIRVDDGDIIRIPAADFSGSSTLPLQTPGGKRISVKAFDLAGNSIENHVDIEILPIDPPTITFVTEELFSDEKQGLTVKGTALPDTDVLLEVQNTLREGRGEVVAKNTAHSNELGNWEFTFNQPFRNGRYIVSAQSRDARGALSLIVESPVVLVKAKPIIHIGALCLGKVGALIVLLLVIAGGFGGGIWFNTKRQKERALRLMIVKTDMAKVFQLILNDIKRLQMAIDIPNKPKEEFTMKKLKETIKKMEGYLKKEMDRLK